MTFKSTVLVTGGSGYIGGFCIAELLNQGYAVRTTVRSLAKEAAVRKSLAPFVSSTKNLTFYEADLTADQGWDDAVTNCDYVLHVASPLGIPVPKNPDDLIKPARDGTIRVINASINANVKRVVMTSSVAAAHPTKEQGDVADETSWTDVNDPTITAYEKSKTLAEKVAHDLINKSDGQTTLATVNPSLVLGPVLGNGYSDSLQIVYRLLNGKVPGIPNLGFCIVDVRDVATLHVLAMTSPQAEGQRFMAAGDFVWMKDMAKLLRDNLGQGAKRVPNISAPDILIHFISLFWHDLRALTPMLSKRRVYDSSNTFKLLGWQPRPARESILDCAHSLINSGLLK